MPNLIWKHQLLTCWTWPGWRWQRRWACPRVFWQHQDPFKLAFNKKIQLKHVPHLIWKHRLPTCWTRPSWRWRRRWACPRAFWQHQDPFKRASNQKIQIKHVPHSLWKHWLATCWTRPGWRWRRRWACPRAFWQRWGLSQWISREKLHIKHVPYVNLKILTSFLSPSQWLSLSTPMGVIMMRNLVGWKFYGQFIVTKVIPESFIRLSQKLLPFPGCTVWLPLKRHCAPPPLPSASINSFSIFPWEFSPNLIDYFSIYKYWSKYK